MHNLKCGKWYWVQDSSKKQFREQVVRENGDEYITSDAFGYVRAINNSSFICEADSRPIYPSEVICSILILVFVFLAGRFSAKFK